LPFAASEGRRVDREGHTHGRLVHRNGRQRQRLFRVGDGFPDVDFRQTDDGDDFAGGRLLGFRAAESFEDVNPRASTV